MPAVLDLSAYPELVAFFDSAPTYQLAATLNESYSFVQFGMRKELTPLQISAALGKDTHFAYIWNTQENISEQLAETLRQACYYNQTEIINFLLADSRIKTNEFLLLSILRYAVKENNLDLLEQLLRLEEIKENVHLIDLFTMALLNRNYEIARRLFVIPSVRTQYYLQHTGNDLIEFNRQLELEVTRLIRQKTSFTQKQYPTLFTIYERHNGLCDVICNYFTLMNVGRMDDPIEALNRISGTVAQRFGPEKAEKLAQTHVLSLVTFFEFLRYIFIGDIPHSILNLAEQRAVRSADRSLNVDLLSEKFESLPVGTYIKFCMYNSTPFGFPESGHNMLIYKTDDERYMFFSPDQTNPRCEFYSKEDLILMLSNLSQAYSNIAFIDNMRFMERVNQNVKETVTQTIEGSSTESAATAPLNRNSFFSGSAARSNAISSDEPPTENTPST